MRWNNNHANTINYRALIRLAFAMAIIAAMLMAILDHHQESSPAISSERITQLNQALRKKLSHDLYARVSVTSSRIVLKRTTSATTEQQLKQQLEQLSSSGSSRPACQSTFKTQMAKPLRRSDSIIKAGIAVKKGLKSKLHSVPNSHRQARWLFVYDVTYPQNHGMASSSLYIEKEKVLNDYSVK